MQDDSTQLNDDAGEMPDGGDAALDADLGLVDGGTGKTVNKGTLLIFGVVVIAAGAFFLMRQRTGPASAAAAVSPEADAAKATIDQFLSDGSKNIRAMQDMLRNTEKVVQRFQTFPARKQVPLDDLRSDPFQLFQQAKAIDPEVERKKQAELKANALAAVKRLKLQSVLYGERRSCLINGDLWTEGQSVEGVTIEKINPNSIVVECNGFRFEMKAAR